MKFKIVSIIGTRPQLIKVAEMDKVIQDHPNFIHFIIHTGQHYDDEMSLNFFGELSIPEPHAFLNVNQGTHGQNTGAMIPQIEELLDSLNPDIVLVYGDCDSTLAGTLAAKKMDIPVGHIEAGVRSFDMKMPEEINRVMVDSVSDLLLCPTKNACDILDNVGVTPRIFNCGDLMYDSFKRYEGERDYLPANILGEDYYFVTVHRKENTDNPDNLINIIQAFSDINERIYFPVHPRTRQMLTKYKLPIPGNITILNPTPYLETLSWMKHAKCVLTDSGGMQKEAFWLKTPCVTMRNSTEWPETLKDNWNILTGADRERILLAVKTHEKMTRKNPPGFIYGSGAAGTKILNVINQFLKAR